MQTAIKDARGTPRKDLCCDHHVLDLVISREFNHYGVRVPMLKCNHCNYSTDHRFDAKYAFEKIIELAKRVAELETKLNNLTLQ